MGLPVRFAASDSQRQGRGRVNSVTRRRFFFKSTNNLTSCCIRSIRPEPSQEANDAVRFKKTGTFRSGCVDVYSEGWMELLCIADQPI